MISPLNKHISRAEARLNDEEMFNHLENFGMLDAMVLDYATLKLTHLGIWSNNASLLWQKFIRS